MCGQTNATVADAMRSAVGRGRAILDGKIDVDP